MHQVATTPTKNQKKRFSRRTAEELRRNRENGRGLIGSPPFSLFLCGSA
jgi:hypothetical protein